MEKKKRVRRTKAELQAAGYYDEKKQRQASPKKRGRKSKETTSTQPDRAAVVVPRRPDRIYTYEGRVVDTKIKFREGGGGFYCPIEQTGLRDSHCKLFCKHVGCPYYEIGYYNFHTGHSPS